MKNRTASLSSAILLLAIVLAPAQAQQPCAPGTVRAAIQPNNITAFVNTGGRLFNNGGAAGLLPNPGGGNVPGSIGTIYSAAFWLGGVGPAGNLKLAASDYKAGFFAGPLTPDGMTDAQICENWNRVFTVKGSRIAQFLDALAGPVDPQVADFQDIFGWPGRGNPRFEDVQGFSLPFNSAGLAPFFDADSDGSYNPMNGDHPAVMLRGKPSFVPAEIAWCVFNDNGGGAVAYHGGKPFQIEVQLTAWGFNCTDQPVLNNTVFTSHKVINRATERTDSVFAGLWTDFDLGCYEDDYVGCDPARSTVFAYNQDAVDGNPGASCSGQPTFGTDIPVQTMRLLNGPFSKVIVANSTQPATGDPIALLEYYRFLTGHWRDGTPMTLGGSGYGPGGAAPPTDFLFPDNPADPNGWSMCTANLPISDRRVVASQRIDSLLPGQVFEFDAAWTTHWPSTGYLPCGLGNALAETDAVQAAFDTGFADVCSGLSVSEKTPGDLEGQFSIAPNPAAGDFEVVFGASRPRLVEVFSADGRLVFSASDPSGERLRVPGEGLPTGVFVVRAMGEKGMFARRVLVQR